jgi:mono/diheme cytochrome c family protein
LPHQPEKFPSASDPARGYPTCYTTGEEDDVRHIALVALLAFAPAPAVLAQDKTVAQGQKLYVDQKCSVCHSIAGKGNAKGPLDNVGAKLSEEEIRQWLIAPRVMAEKTKATRKPMMPEYTKLPKQDLDALITYMRSLKKS